MPLDNQQQNLTPDQPALALAGSSAACDLSQAGSERAGDAPFRPISNTVGKLGQLVEPTCKSQICPSDAPESVPQLAGYPDQPAKKPRRQRASRAQDTGPGVQSLLDGAFFDWFQGVIPSGDGDGTCVVGGEEERSAIRDACEFLRQSGLRSGKMTSGGVGYATATPFVVGRTGSEKVASVASGSYTGGMPNLTVTGGKGLCAVLAPMIQRRWPEFRATRIDVAMDLHGDEAVGLWDVLYDMSRDFAPRHRGLPMETKGTETPERGRTFYLGDRENGDVFLRVYEKGLQMQADAPGGDLVENAPPREWIRIEFVMRNIDGDLKSAFGQLSPGDMIRSKIWPRKWLAEAVHAAGISDRIEPVSPIRMRVGQSDKDARTTMRHGVYQYMGAFARVAHDDIMTRREAAVIGQQGPVCARVSRDDLEAEMVEVFRHELRYQAQRLDAVIERFGLCDQGDMREEADAIAVAMQEARLRDMRQRLAATRSVAEAVRNGDDEEVKSAAEAVRALQERLAGAEDAPRQEALFKAERKRGRRRRERRDYFAEKAARNRKGRVRK